MAIFKKILKWFLITIGIVVLLFVFLIFIGSRSITNNTDGSGTIKSIFDKQFLSEKEYHKKWGKQGNANKEIYNFKNDQYYFEEKELNFSYPENWLIDKRPSIVSIYTKNIDNRAELPEYVKQEAILNIFVATINDDRNLEEYIKILYMLDDKKDLPKNIINIKSKDSCYKVINEKPESEFYYKNYDTVKIIYYCENSKNIKYSFSMETAVPEKFIDVFEKIYLSIEVK